MPFHGRVLKIEPQATVQQNVTMFPVLIGIANPRHLLRPGMNTEVELSVGDRREVLAIPNAALRTQRDVASAAQVLGLSAAEVEAQLASARSQAEGDSLPRPEGERFASHSGVPDAQTSAAGVLVLPDGREVKLPPGVEAAQVRAAMGKRMSGKELSPAEQSLLRQVFAGVRRDGGGRAGGGREVGGRVDVFRNTYIVFALRGGLPAAREIHTGLTDLDHIEVTGGLAEGDTVLVLPSASLLQQQREFRERFTRMSGGGLPGVQQQQQQPRSGTQGPRG